MKRDRASPLAAGEFVSAPRHGGLPLLRQIHDEAVRIRGFGCIEHHIVVGIRLAEFQIEAHVTLKQERILKSNANDLSQVVLGNIPYIDSVDRDAAVRHVIETRQCMPVTSARWLIITVL